MRHLFIALLLLLCIPAASQAQLSQFSNSDGTRGTIYGSPQSGLQMYQDNRGTRGTIYGTPESGMQMYNFTNRQGQTSTGTIYSTPAPPVMQPLPQMPRAGGLQDFDNQMRQFRR